ncbi:relaxase/mobilization nuclease domain-containing protein [Bifidobacterium sp. ESL0784]|uniref:relaxase/mobilization nuclease domain-containing protein n=1 Tax=Bifidobacterium sp. ESL0784 TaxID=2983231 RepID=UPI0023F7C91E|nr:relaxase/mobilization nuclease domain-containing protein [Bifidobacterium sp. ESL0784]MDF7641490.1 relaxase/mobilization nuclease domain-containing protein [Bifidobacterium sp. ESL0784]
MAVVKVGQVKSTLAKAVRYITNPEKTDGYRLVSTTTGRQVDDAQGIADVYLRNIGRAKGGAGRKGAVLAEHIIQSFDPEDDITPEQAHSLGIRFVHEIVGEEYDFTIATHTDRHHIHNHILLCPNSNLTHRNLKPYKVLGRWREASDRLCRENGLHTIAPKPVRHPAPQIGELNASADGRNVKDMVRTAIGRACQEAHGFDDFRSLLSGLGVDVSVRGRHLTYTAAASGRRFRDVRLGVGCGEQEVMGRIGRRTMNMFAFDRTLVANRDAMGVRVWLPGSGRKLMLAIPANRIVRDGRTFRAYLARDVRQVLTGPDGIYAQTVDCDGLYEWFAKPKVRLEDYARRRLFPSDLRGLGGRAIATALACDRLRESLDELQAISRVVDHHTTRREAFDRLTGKVESGEARMRELVVAIAVARDQGDSTERLERELDAVCKTTGANADEALALRRILERDRKAGSHGDGPVRPNRPRRRAT